MKEIKKLTKEEILKNLKLFNMNCGPLERGASFDYCFNYFQEKYRSGKLQKIADTKDIQLSCLQLGFYLASWGMYKGATFLLQKSIKIFEPLIKYISSDECDVWDIDVDNYTNENIGKLIKCGKRIEKALKVHETKKATDTLITKIMLGIFGNTPAFDSYFKKGSRLGTFNEHSLEQIKNFYDDNQKIITMATKDNKTLEYLSGCKSKRTYTKAKIIDMIFFANGNEMGKKL